MDVVDSHEKRIATEEKQGAAVRANVVAPSCESIGCPLLPCSDSKQILATQRTGAYARACMLKAPQRCFSHSQSQSRIDDI